MSGCSKASKQQLTRATRAFPFNETGVRHGRLHLSCKDVSTFQWLQSSVADITLSLTDDSEETLRLQLVTPAEVPKLLRAEVYISGPPPGVPKFTKLLRDRTLDSIWIDGFCGISSLQARACSWSGVLIRNQPMLSQRSAIDLTLG